MKTKYLLTLLIMLLAFSFAYSTNHSGTISSNETWSVANNPHIITGDLTITSGATITVEDYCVVEMKANVYISNGCKLDIGEGTIWKIIPSSNTVTFKIDIQGEMDAIGNGVSGDFINFYSSGIYASTGWLGIQITGNADNCNFNYCDIKDGIKNNNSSYNLDANDCGGAFFIDACSTMDVEITYCNIYDNEASGGAGIFIKNGTSKIDINNNDIYNNEAYDGGGIFVSESSIQLNSNNIERNYVDNCGGGVYLASVSSYPAGIVSSTITENEAFKNGGGVFIDAGSPYISNNTIQNNEAQKGGGIALSNNTTTWIYNNTIENNYASINGGGIHCVGSSPEISYNGYNGGSISYNKADNDGGGVFLLNSDPEFIGNNLIENEADYDYDDNGNGGGIYYEWDDESGILNGIYLNEFRTNSAYNGGGIFYKDNQAIGGEYKFINNLVVNNSVVNDGGGIFLDELFIRPLINSNTIADNDAGNEGGGVFSEGWLQTQGRFNNNLIYYNTPNSGNTYLSGQLSDYPAFNECDIEGKSGTNYNSFDSVPVFYDRNNGNYHLRWSPTRSPALDQGDANQSRTSVDMDNNNRVIFGNIDMGCYEHNHINWLIFYNNNYLSENELNENIMEIDEFSVSVYPNPFVDKVLFNIGSKIDENCVLLVTDINGKEVWKKQFEFESGIKTIVWNASDVSKGIYLLKVCINNNKVKVFKLFKR